MAIGARSRTTQRAIAQTERIGRALELRKQGLTFEKIAEKCGYADKRSAQRAVMSAIQAITREPAEGVRELELARLDEMLAMLWPKMLKGDQWAVDRILAIMERRSRFLGLDAPPDATLTAEVLVRRYVGVDPDAV